MLALSVLVQGQCLDKFFVGATREEFVKGLTKEGMHPVCGNGARRNENEIAAMHARMRNGEKGRFQHGVAIQENIDIEGARRAWYRTFAPKGVFDALREVQKRRRRKARARRENGVRIFGNFGKHRAGLVEMRRRSIERTPYHIV